MKTMTRATWEGGTELAAQYAITTATAAKINSRKKGNKKKRAYCQFAFKYRAAAPLATMWRKARDDLASRFAIGPAKSRRTMSSHSSSSYAVSTCQLAAFVVTFHCAFEASACGARSDTAALTFQVRAKVASSRLNSRYQAAPIGSYPAM